MLYCIVALLADRCVSKFSTDRQLRLICLLGVCSGGLPCIPRHWLLHVLCEAGTLGVLCTCLGSEGRCAWGFWSCLRPDGCAMLMRPNKDLPPSTSANAAAMLIARCLKLVGKLMCRPLPFWLWWSRPLNRRSQPIKLQRVLKQVQAWLGEFPRHSHPPCSPKHRPWRGLSTSFGFDRWSG